MHKLIPGKSSKKNREQRHPPHDGYQSVASDDEQSDISSEAVNVPLTDSSKKGKLRWRSKSAVIKASSNHLSDKTSLNSKDKASASQDNITNSTAPDFLNSMHSPNSTPLPANSTFGSPVVFSAQKPKGNVIDRLNVMQGELDRLTEKFNGFDAFKQNIAARCTALETKINELITQLSSKTHNTLLPSDAFTQEEKKSLQDQFKQLQAQYQQLKRSLQECAKSSEISQCHSLNSLQQCLNERLSAWETWHSDNANKNLTEPFPGKQQLDQEQLNGVFDYSQQMTKLIQDCGLSLSPEQQQYLLRKAVIQRNWNWKVKAEHQKCLAIINALKTKTSTELNQAACKNTGLLGVIGVSQCVPWGTTGKTIFKAK